MGAQRPFNKDFWLNESNSPVRVNDLVQDNIGYIWLAAENGVYRFNGRTFTAITDSIHQPVTAIAAAGDNIWVGYANGTIGVVIRNFVTPIHTVNASPRSPVLSIHVDKAGQLWVCTEVGTYVINNNIGILLDTGSGLSDNYNYNALVMKDYALIATDQGLNIVRSMNGKVLVNAITTKNGLPDNIVRILKRVPGTQSFWIGTQEGGVIRLDLATNNASWQITKNGNKWLWGQVNDIIPLGRNRAWVITDDGYLLHVSLVNDSVSVIPYPIQGKKLYKLIMDKSGNIWCATNQGITMITAEYASFIKIDSFSLHNLTAIICDKNDVLWFAENNRLFSMHLNDSVDIPRYNTSVPAAITCIYPDTAKGLWMGTFGKGVWYWKEGEKSPRQITDIPTLNNSSILDLAGYNDRVWVASLNGVEEITTSGGGKVVDVKHHNKRSGIGSDYVYRLFIDRLGHVWMATDGAGVCMYDGQQYYHWDSSSGLNSKVIYTIAQDIYGNMWAGTFKGLYSFNGKTWRRITRRNGLQDINIYTVLANASGQVIIVNQKGVDEWYPGSGQYRQFRRHADLGIDSLSNMLNCAANDMEGNVYVPYEHGFTIFKSIHTAFDIKPEVHISEVSMFLNPINSYKHNFSYNENHISFYFEGISYSNMEQLHYRYMLGGHNDAWILTDDESATFAQLPPGKYLFRVQASLSDNFDNAKEARYSFSIAPPVWRRWWFILFVILVVLAIGYVYIKIREKRFKKISQLQKERMIFEYEHLKSQVNPHFLFNSLNTLTNLIEEDKDTAIDYTVQLSDLYRKTLAYRDKDLINLSEEWEILSSYIYIQKSRFGDALCVEVDIPEDIMERKKIIPLALQLLVENAIKHNIVSASKPLSIHIIATANDITVRNTLQLKISKEKGSGLGLINIRKRYALLTNKRIKFGAYKNEFIVILPLL